VLTTITFLGERQDIITLTHGLGASLPTVKTHEPDPLQARRPHRTQLVVMAYESGLVTTI
jgi:hypothetical protein